MLIEHGPRAKQTAVAQGPWPTGGIVSCDGRLAASGQAKAIDAPAGLAGAEAEAAQCCKC